MFNKYKGTEFDRKFILGEISKGSEWGDSSTIINFSVIKEVLEFLKINLKLNELDMELQIYERSDKSKLLGSLTARQMHCIAMINGDALDGNIQGAYHELYDFIASYNNLQTKPIDIVERIIIRNSIIQIENMFNKICNTEELS